MNEIENRTWVKLVYRTSQYGSRQTAKNTKSSG